MAVYPHHRIDITSGILTGGTYVNDGSDVDWGGNALQTVTVAIHTPRDPQQAVGYRGVVDYTDGIKTSDITLDCILVESCTEATTGGAPDSSVYQYAECQEGYVLTSCNVGFTAGAPATVSYGYQASGAAESISTKVSGAVQTGDTFAVILGDTTGNEGVVLAPVHPSGVQSLTFAATINRDNVLDVRSAQPIVFITTYPIDITVDIESYESVTQNTTFSVSTGSLQGGANADKLLVQADGLVRVDRTQSVNVGGYLTYTQSFTATNMYIPMTAISPP